MSSESDTPEDEGRTVFQPSDAAAVSSNPPAPEPTASEPPVAPLRPASAAGRVEVGVVLNSIYEVKRFIARGGMGEVFEGANVNSDERVAIKVMLPQLAADPNVQEMFRKEARTLTKLSHPAVVQYRLLAQEPQLGVLYIVTEFIDGASLADVTRGRPAGEPELRMLLRRMAAGLQAAHELGAVHRDIAPDNVLLPEGRLDRAKIIDFGIAKDLDPSKATIVGDGFAGKLGYVAPEQFGDFGRQVGPWTDVYSLGLVILAAAQGHDVDMGATLVEAIDRRRAGPDLTPVPAGLRPVLERMLKADPAERLRSMDEVLAALDAPTAAAAPAQHAAEATVWAPASASKPPAAPATPHAGAQAKPPGLAKVPRHVLIGAAGAAAVVLTGIVALMMLGKHPAKPAAASAVAVADAGLPKAEVVRRAVEGALGGVSCSWLDLVPVADQGSGAIVKLTGVALSPAAAESAVTQAVGAANAKVAEVDLDDVYPASQPMCMPLDAFRTIRVPTSESGQKLATADRKYKIMQQGDKLAGKAVITMNIGDQALEFALFGMEPSGKITAITSRADLAKDLSARQVQDLGADKYQLNILTSHSGWSGLLLLTGKGPFDDSLIAASADRRDSGWPARFRQAAAARGWKAEMVWYQTE